ncbi:hypothetical protein CYY_000425 [Polysphondylium violaceum]|uniref:Ankyrin repeat-containing protein n=1 Tax=Polysphondylium violaceum TaxID=133409 RepID=A0A8J4Q3T4_9MYCE|nr:hypothetical protein CYY_000425 [Polysphondylium violaceum]
MINFNNQLFFYIWKNKYLNHTIWYQLKQQSNQHIYNIKNFEECHSLNWMLQNGYLELLEYRLKRNDYISVDSNNVEDLIKTIFTDININNQLEDSSNNNSNSNISKEKIFNFLKLVINRLSFIFSTTKASLDIAISCKNYLAIVILCQDLKVLVEKSSLDLAISLGDKKTLEYLLLFQNGTFNISCALKKMIQISNNNEKLRDNMIEYLLECPFFDIDQLTVDRLCPRDTIFIEDLLYSENLNLIKSLLKKNLIKYSSNSFIKGVSNISINYNQKLLLDVNNQNNNKYQYSQIVYEKYENNGNINSNINIQCNNNNSSQNNNNSNQNNNNNINPIYPTLEGKKDLNIIKTIVYIYNKCYCKEKKDLKPISLDQDLERLEEEDNPNIAFLKYIVFPLESILGKKYTVKNLIHYSMLSGSINLIKSLFKKENPSLYTKSMIESPDWVLLLEYSITHINIDFLKFALTNSISEGFTFWSSLDLIDQLNIHFSVEKYQFHSIQMVSNLTHFLTTLVKRCIKTSNKQLINLFIQFLVGVGNLKVLEIFYQTILNLSPIAFLPSILYINTQILERIPIESREQIYHFLFTPEYEIQFFQTRLLMGIKENVNINVHQILKNAFIRGDIQLVRVLVQKGNAIRDEYLINAIQRNQYQVVEYVIKTMRYNPTSLSDLINCAIVYDISILNLFESLLAPNTPKKEINEEYNIGYYLYNLLKAGKLNCFVHHIQTLISNNRIKLITFHLSDFSIFRIIGMIGNTNLVKFIDNVIKQISLSTYMYKLILYGAFSKGHLHIVRYLFENELVVASLKNYDNHISISQIFYHYLEYNNSYDNEMLEYILQLYKPISKPIDFDEQINLLYNQFKKKKRLHTCQYLRDRYPTSTKTISKYPFLIGIYIIILFLILSSII